MWNVLCLEFFNLIWHVNSWAKQASNLILVLRCFISLARPSRMEFTIQLCCMFSRTYTSFHSRTGYLVIGMRGKTQIHALTLSTGTFPVSQPFTLSAWFRNLERCMISFRPQGLHLVYCSVNLLKGIDTLSSQDSLWLVRSNSFTERSWCLVMCF